MGIADDGVNVIRRGPAENLCMVAGNQRIAQRVILVTKFDQTAGKGGAFGQAKPGTDRACGNVSHHDFEGDDCHLTHKLFTVVETTDEMGGNPQFAKGAHNLFRNDIVHDAFFADGTFFLCVECGGVVLEILDNCSGLGAVKQDFGLAFVKLFAVHVRHFVPISSSTASSLPLYNSRLDQKQSFVAMWTPLFALIPDLRVGHDAVWCAKLFSAILKYVKYSAVLENSFPASQLRLKVKRGIHVVPRSHFRRWARAVQEGRDTMSLSDREKAFEDKFQHDEQIRFKVEARQVKLFGLWVAEQIGKTGAEAESYAKELVAFNLGAPGLEDVVEKVAAELKDFSWAASPQDIRERLNSFEAPARQQILSE